MKNEETGKVLPWWVVGIMLVIRVVAALIMVAFLDGGAAKRVILTGSTEVV